jgi:hypothetical protein
VNHENEKKRADAQGADGEKRKRRRRRREFVRIPEPDRELIAQVRERAAGKHEQEAEDLVWLYMENLSLARFFQNVFPRLDDRDDCLVTARLCKKAMYSYLRGRHRTPAGAERGEVEGEKRKYRKRKGDAGTPGERR